MSADAFGPETTWGCQEFFGGDNGTATLETKGGIELPAHNLSASRSRIERLLRPSRWEDGHKPPTGGPSRNNPTTKRYTASTRKCRSGEWLFGLEVNGKTFIRPYKCKLAGCPDPFCWQYANRKLFLGLEGPVLARPEPCLYLVLTLRSAARKDILGAYMTLGKLWERFAREVRKEFGTFHYVALAEQHKKKPVPHLNVLIWNREMAQAHDEGFWRLWRWLGKALRRAGFGRMKWIRPSREPLEDVGYGLKLNASTPSQVTQAAPQGFRRLRTSRGFREAAGPAIARPKAKVRLWKRSAATRNRLLSAADPGAGWPLAPESHKTLGIRIQRYMSSTNGAFVCSFSRTANADSDTDWLTGVPGAAATIITVLICTETQKGDDDHEHIRPG